MAGDLWTGYHTEPQCSQCISAPRIKHLGIARVWTAWVRLYLPHNSKDYNFESRSSFTRWSVVKFCSDILSKEDLCVIMPCGWDILEVTNMATNTASTELFGNTSGEGLFFRDMAKVVQTSKELVKSFWCSAKKSQECVWFFLVLFIGGFLLAR